jgi:integrase
MFNKGENIGWKGENPARRIELFPESSRDRFLLPEELPAFFRALAEEPNPIFQGFFLLSLLTGARRANVQAMRWSDVSFDLRRWRIPETKAGVPVVVPLTPLAFEVLEKLKEYRRPDCDWVFPGRRLNGGHLVTPNLAWKRLLKRAGLENLRIHDLRRSLGSWQALTGASLQVIGKSLGHLRQETTAIYSRLTLDPVRESVEKATDAIRVAAGGQLPRIGQNGGHSDE